MSTIRYDGKAAVLFVLDPSRSKAANEIAQSIVGTPCFQTAPFVGMDGKAWLRHLSRLVESCERHGFTEEGFDATGIAPCSDVHPMLLVSADRAMLVQEIQSPDRGPIPICAIEMLVPQYTDEILTDHFDLLGSCGYNICADGRSDYFVNLDGDFASFLRGHSQVARDYKKGTSCGVVTVQIDQGAFLEIIAEPAGNKLYAETAAHRAFGTSGSAAFSSDKARSLVARNFELEGGYDTSSFIDLYSSPGWRFFATYHGPTLVALSHCHIRDNEFYWVSTNSLRSGIAVDLRSAFNLLNCIILSMVEQAYLEGLTKFNLGISIFDYKKQFKPCQSSMPGLKSASL